MGELRVTAQQNEKFYSSVKSTIWLEKWLKLFYNKNLLFLRANLKKAKIK
jgi:hypothetical protein